MLHTPPTYQGLQLLGVNKAELRDKVVEVLVARVHVRLRAHLCNAVKVVDVHVHKHTEQPRQDLAHCLQEVLGERCAWRWAEEPWRRPLSVLPETQAPPQSRQPSLSCAPP